MSKHIKKFKNRSHIVHAMLFMILTLVLVAGNAIAEHYLANLDRSLNWGIFTIATGSDYTAVNSGEIFNANSNPLLFSFIEIPGLPGWATYVTSTFALLLLATTVIFVKNKSSVIMLSIIVAGLGGNLIDAIFLDPAEFIQDPASGTVVFERNFYINWLGGIGMNLLDMFVLFGTAGFTVYLLIKFIISAVRGRTKKVNESEYNEEIHEYAEDIKDTIPEATLAKEMAPVVAPYMAAQEEMNSDSEQVEEPKVITPYVPQQEAPVFKQDRPKKNTPQPVEVVNTPAPEMSRVTEPKPVVEPAPVFKQERAPQPQVVTPTPAPVVEAPVFKQERTPQPQVVTPTPTPVVPASPKTVAPKTAEELEEEAMRESLASLRDAW